MSEENTMNEWKEAKKRVEPLKNVVLTSIIIGIEMEKKEDDKDGS